MLVVFLYLITGFIWEMLITSYHHCVIARRKILVSLLAVVITLISLLVVSSITKEIIVAKGWLVYLYILVFAIGKGFGAYMSLTWWINKDKKLHKTD